MKAVSEMVNDGDVFTHTVTLGIMNNESGLSLKQGNTMTGANGFNWYANNGKTASLLDHKSGDTWSVSLDGAIILTAAISSVSAIVALTF